MEGTFEKPIGVDRLAAELLLGLLCGVASYVGVMLARKLDDPYSEPRLTLGAWLQRARGGDTA